MDTTFSKIAGIKNRPGAKMKSLAGKRLPTAPRDPNYMLKVGVWVYFFLWIFDGAVRKWIAPLALSQPLLLIRDPVVLWLMIVCFRRGLLKVNIYLTGMIIIGVISLFTAMFFGHGNIWVALYGARTLLLYLPMIFVIGRVFNYDDVIKVGKVLILMAIPMTLLIAMQFYSPQSAWVNRAAGGVEGAGFDGAGGFFRPPGTFSFANGNVAFYTLLAPFILFFWISPQKINRLLLLGATGALIVAIPISIARSLVFQVIISVIFLLIAIARKPKYLGKVLMVACFVMVALLLFSNASFFKTALVPFTARLEGANESEGGLVKGVIGDRFFGGLLKAINGSSDQSAFGLGIGSGTPLGEQLLHDDSVSKLSDSEWPRQMGELGLMGLVVIGLRVGLAVKLSIASYRKLVNNNMLPWLLMSVGILIVTQGQWHQATSLGFFSLMGGLWLASLKNAKINKLNKKPDVSASRALSPGG